VQFAEDALPDGKVLREAWFELRVDGAEALQQKALSVGLKRVGHPSTPFCYVQAPGGRVFRISDTADPTMEVVRGYHAAWTIGILLRTLFNHRLT
jgi:hypothetical protein